MKTPSITERLSQLQTHPADPSDEQPNRTPKNTDIIDQLAGRLVDMIIGGSNDFENILQADHVRRRWAQDLQRAASDESTLLAWRTWSAGLAPGPCWIAEVYRGHPASNPKDQYRNRRLADIMEVLSWSLGPTVHLFMAGKLKCCESRQARLTQ